jgi:small subunit ribosomal protein S20
LANTAQARKRAKQDHKRYLANSSQRSAMRTAIKAVRYAIIDKNVEIARPAFQKAVSSIDKMVNKGLLHKNTAARYKSRINKKLKDLVSHA